MEMNNCIYDEPNAYLRLWRSKYGHFNGKKYILHHTCHNGPNCVNLNHLELMERSAHSAMHSKGEGNGNSKLVESEVRIIFQLGKNTDMTRRQIVKYIEKRFGKTVTKTAVNEIIWRKTWRHLEI